MIPSRTSESLSFALYPHESLLSNTRLKTFPWPPSNVPSLSRFRVLSNYNFVGRQIKHPETRPSILLLVHNLALPVVYTPMVIICHIWQHWCWSISTRRRHVSSLVVTLRSVPCPSCPKTVRLIAAHLLMPHIFPSIILAIFSLPSFSISCLSLSFMDLIILLLSQQCKKFQSPLVSNDGALGSAVSKRARS